MPLEPGDKLWIAEAPHGIPTPGPTIIFDLSKYGIAPDAVLNQYKKMGWTITPAVVTNEKNNAN